MISSVPFFYPQNPQHLSNEEFESLKRVVQLLRISQLRFIVQKFSIPASGNKTKLLGLLLSIFNSLRYDRVLINIYNEINNILSKKESNSIKQLEIITQFDPNFISTQNPLQVQSGPPFMLGPILVPIGQSSGKFGFMYSDTNEDLSTSINISFLFPDGKAQQFAFKGEINGFPFEVSIDDPYPQPIDITEYININTIMNTLNIKMIKTSSQMMICVREYKFCGIQNLMNQVIGRAVNIDEEDFDVFSNSCQHKGTFSLVSFLSKSFGTGNWNCPICGQPIDCHNIKVSATRNIKKDIDKVCNQFSPFGEINASESSSLTTLGSSQTLTTSTSTSITPPKNVSIHEELISDHSIIHGITYMNNNNENTDINSNNTGDIFKMSDMLDSFDWDQI